MNSFLPEFYKAKYKHCQNRKDFVKQFHGTGRQLYQLKQQIDGIEKQIDSMMNKENPAAVGAVFDGGYSLVPSDNIRITNNTGNVPREYLHLMLSWSYRCHHSLPGCR